MLNRIAVHLWHDLAMLPATVNDEGDVLHITQKSRDKLEDALRPWTVKERKDKDADMAAQWANMYNNPNADNPIAQALRKQQMIIAGLQEPDPET